MTLLVAKNGVLAVDRGLFCSTFKSPTSKIHLKKENNIYRAVAGAGDMMDIEFLTKIIMSKEYFSKPDLTKIMDIPKGTSCLMLAIQKHTKTNKIQTFLSYSYHNSQSPANNSFYLDTTGKNEFFAEGELVARSLAHCVHDYVKDLAECKNNIPLQLFKIFQSAAKYNTAIHVANGINIVDMNAKKPKIRTVNSEEDIIKYFKG